MRHRRHGTGASPSSGGEQYLDDLNLLRCKIVGHWYCARFDGVLDTIERDGYILRSSYNERRSPSTLFNILRLTASVTLRHAVGRVP